MTDSIIFAKKENVRSPQNTFRYLELDFFSFSIILACNFTRKGEKKNVVVYSHWKTFDAFVDRLWNIIFQERKITLFSPFASTIHETNIFPLKLDKSGNNLDYVLLFSIFMSQISWTVTKTVSLNFRRKETNKQPLIDLHVNCESNASSNSLPVVLSCIRHVYYIFVRGNCKTA